MSQASNILTEIRSALPGLSRTFNKIGEHVLADPADFSKLPLRDLSKSIGVSEPSILRFGREFGVGSLPELRFEIARALGMSEVSGLAALEPALAAKTEVNIARKQAIAHAAEPLLNEDTAIILDSGSTILAFADVLRNAAPLTVMTTGIATLLSLRDCAQHKLMIPGGTFRADAMSVTGRMVEDALSKMQFDTAYVGADSISLDVGLATYSEEESHLTCALIGAARRVVVLADSTKFRAPRLHRICDLKAVDVIVSDAGLCDHTAGMLRDTGINLIVAADEQEIVTEAENV